MSNVEWRPKGGERVVIYATVPREGTADGRICVRMADGNHHWLAPRNLSPLPTPTPREPWDVLREAHDLIPEYEQTTRFVLTNTANRLEAAARPKPLPTLAEAVRAYVNNPDIHHAEIMKEALAREEAAKEARQ